MGRRCGIVASLLVALVIAGCTSSNESAATTTSFVVPDTTADTGSIAPQPSSTSVSALTPTTVPAPSSSVDSTTGEALHILRTDGIGPVDFGTPSDEAIAALTQILGPPDGEELLGPDRYCDQYIGWKSCVRVVSAGRIVHWTEHGLEVVLTDYGGSSDAPAVPMSIRSWVAAAPATGPGLATTEGLDLGMTFERALRLYPTASVEVVGDEGLLVGVNLFFGGGRAAGGTVAYYVGFAGWSYKDQVAAVQQALNRHGADLDVDGIVGELTIAAWMEFCVSRSLDCAEPPGWISDHANSAALELDLRSRTISSLMSGLEPLL